MYRNIHINTTNSTASAQIYAENLKGSLWKQTEQQLLCAGSHSPHKTNSIKSLKASVNNCTKRTRKTQMHNNSFYGITSKVTHQTTHKA